MVNIQVIKQHLIIIFTALKHCFIALINLIRGGIPLKDLSSEIVLITGAASGLGKGIAQRLAHLGCTLVLWDIDEVSNARVAEDLNTATNSNRIYAMKCDLTNKENIYECARKVQGTIGHVTMIINNAGASGLVDYCSSKFAAVGLHEALTEFLLLFDISISSTAAQIEAQGMTGLQHSMDTFVERH
ncbi:unnamed protein product [Rotaria sp. Silwood1]|nr:unnamed protein product [Rotaria sp. Silwood1]